MAGTHRFLSGLPTVDSLYQTTPDSTLALVMTRVFLDSIPRDPRAPVRSSVRGGATRHAYAQTAEGTSLHVARSTLGLTVAEAARRCSLTRREYLDVEVGASVPRDLPSMIALLSVEQ